MVREAMFYRTRDGLYRARVSGKVDDDERTETTPERANWTGVMFDVELILRVWEKEENERKRHSG